jgi:hypothetical protein
MKKIFIYLGFCPGKESAKHFRVKNNSYTQNIRKLKHKSRMMFIGALLIFTGFMPFFFEDSSVTGITDAIILHGRLGLTSIILGLIIIISVIATPRILKILEIKGV